MPFPVDEQYVAQAEASLGVALPELYRQKLMAQNGGELELGPEHFTLFPVLDSSTRKRIKRTCNHLVLETTNSRQWRGFPEHGVAIGANSCGDKLVFLPDMAEQGRLRSTLYRWNHETGAVDVVASDVASVLSPDEMSETTELTEQMIDAAQSEGGGWNREQLACIGVAWPPPKGWKRSVLGKVVDKSTAERFLELKRGGEDHDQLNLF